MRVLSLLLFIGFISLGCQKQKVKEKRYLDMDSLVNVQVNYLFHSKAALKKEATIGDKNSSSSTIPDSTAWSHELDVFRQLDLINRPIYSDVYKIKEGIKDSKSNLLILSFEAPSNSPVPYLRLYYQDTPTRLKKLEALYQEANSLYGSQRKLEMYFDDTNGKSYLKGYSIEGDQKMMMSDRSIMPFVHKLFLINCTKSILSLSLILDGQVSALPFLNQESYIKSIFQNHGQTSSFRRSR